MVWAVSLISLSASLLVAGVTVSIGPPSQPPGLTPSTLKITNGIVSPDGHSRSAILVNGQFPSPVITGYVDTEFHLNVQNALTDKTMQRGTSIHWHGLFQKKTNYADGPVGVSQCPISPNHSFLYEFAADHAGTFWYHSHFSTQYCDGLRGPFIVYDAKDPHRLLYDIDDASTIITLGEWYHTPAPSITGIAIADATLINGRGRYSGGPPAPLSIVNVEKNKRYRIRLISIACDPNYVFSIDNHGFTVIEVDGQNIKPYSTDSIQILAGQRYSFVLKADQSIDNYWIRALPNSGKGDLAKGFSGGMNSAILRYKGAKNVDPKTSQKKNPKLLSEAGLEPLGWDVRAPGEPHPGGADIKLNFDITNNPATLRFAINGVEYQNPTVPVLLQILSGNTRAQDLLPKGSVYPLVRNKVVEITIPGGAPGSPHPFHLHGHSFVVVKSAGVDAKYNFKNPVRRDVVSIGDVGSNITIRFKTDNPGPWFLHCHIDFHLETGLAVVLAEDIPDTDDDVRPPQDWKGLCPTFAALSPSQTDIQTVSAV